MFCYLRVCNRSTSSGAPAILVETPCEVAMWQRAVACAPSFWVVDTKRSRDTSVLEQAMHQSIVRLGGVKQVQESRTFRPKRLHKYSALSLQLPCNAAARRLRSLQKKVIMVLGGECGGTLEILERCHQTLVHVASIRRCIIEQHPTEFLLATTAAHGHGKKYHSLPKVPTATLHVSTPSVLAQSRH